MHGDHLAAHRGFIDLAALVGGVTLPQRTLGNPALQIFRNDIALSQFPIEEALPGVARPKRAIAIERGDARRKAHHGFDEIVGRKHSSIDDNAQRMKRATKGHRSITAPRKAAYSSGVLMFRATRGSSTGTY